MLHLLPIRSYSKEQATTPSTIAQPLPSVIWRRLANAPQLASGHTPASNTNPNETRQFRVEFNKSPARVLFRRVLWKTMFGTRFRPSSLARWRSTLYYEKTGDLSQYTLDIGHTGEIEAQVLRFL